MYNLIHAIPAASDVTKVIGVTILVTLIIAAFVFFLLLMKFFRLWLQAKLSRADVKFSELIGMWLRKVDIKTIVLSKITAVQAGFGKSLFSRWASPQCGACTDRSQQSEH